jgi:hypothetical protein
MSKSQAILFPEAHAPRLATDIHPLLHQVIAQVQPELLQDEPVAQRNLALVERFALRKSNYLPVCCSEALRTILEGMRILLKGSNLNRLQLTLELHRQKIRPQ